MNVLSRYELSTVRHASAMKRCSGVKDAKSAEWEGRGDNSVVVVIDAASIAERSLFGLLVGVDDVSISFWTDSTGL